jgi:hypothetical protein
VFGCLSVTVGVMDLQAKLEVFECGVLTTLSVSKVALRRRSTNEWVWSFGGVTLA